VTSLAAIAQESNQKIIFDVTRTDNKVYQSVLVTLKIMSASSPTTKFEVIAYGEAVPMLMKNQSIVAGEIEKFIENNNVLFTACEISVGLFNIKRTAFKRGWYGRQCRGRNS
jgi:intracellular sulfur oxidation DsrE/DsrF family protein